ncbi:NemA protein [Neisseria sp. 23W00296]|uniref:hypothetical protein n=1 Tax=unclassified Neisseria TaxID=2623750 RepID=UPI0002A41D0B|nr:MULTISPECIES: hypothetical protein [unclassified Neisseria]ASP17732.1 NemA protein [Neisseria sp. KEM232]EKY04767.1 hypothetical protein HMPREF9120_02109 [Neisseria sp. oral taxon 020 str. F0370]
MKQLAFLLATAAALSACSDTNGTSLSLGIGGFGRHLGLGTSVNIPIGGKTALPDAADAGEKTVAHFSADGKTADSPVKGGYYRRLIGKRGSVYLVQDFYTEDQKRTDPMELPRSALFDADAHPDNGSRAVYARSGELLNQQVYRNGKAVETK